MKFFIPELIEFLSNKDIGIEAKLFGLAVWLWLFGIPIAIVILISIGLLSLLIPVNLFKHV